MFKVNRRKGQKGFTLVEVIVVAVIVAALAAVAIPLYLGYIDSSRHNAASNTAGSAASFCGACVNSGSTVDGAFLGENGGGKLKCTGNTSTMSIPDDIIIELVNDSTRAVKGKHKDFPTDPNIPTFNY